MGLTWPGGGGAYRGAGELDHGPGDGDGDHDASRAPASFSWILETLELYSSLMIPKEGREQWFSFSLEKLSNGGNSWALG